MFMTKKKRELRLVRAFQALFLDKDKKLKPEAEIVLAFWRDEAGARGELGFGGVPYFYDANNRFDANAAAFLLGKRRMFDLLVKYLALDEREVFRLSIKEQENGKEEIEGRIEQELAV